MTPSKCRAELRLGTRRILCCRPTGHPGPHISIREWRRTWLPPLLLRPSLWKVWEEAGSAHDAPIVCRGVDRGRHAAIH
jgi:hypothetical protein